MGDSVHVGASGLSTAVNPLTAQKQSFYQLNNMITDLPGWAVKRPGIGRLGTDGLVDTVASAQPPSAMWVYDDHLFAYTYTGSAYVLAAYDCVYGQGWHQIATSATDIRPDVEKSKLRGCFVDRRQLISTASGVKRIASVNSRYYPSGSTTSVNYSAMYRAAGVARALDPRCRNAVAGGGTDHGLIASAGFEWLNLSSAVAYRICWIRRDENAILQYGMPSGRIVVRNTSTTTNYATRLKTAIPSQITDTSYVMQIYRTNIVSIDGTGSIPDPGDDMFLAGEYRVTSTDLSNGYILYEDVSFDGLLGDELYTNEGQEGPLMGRMQPPRCNDIASFSRSAFFANVTEKQRMIIKVLAVDPSGIGTYKGITVGDAIVAGDLTLVASTLANEEANQWNFATDATTGAGSEVIRAIKTAESFCYKYNILSNAKNGRYAAYNMTTNNDIYGVVMLEEKSVGGSTGAYVGVSRVDAPVQILPAPVFTSTPANTLAQACAVATNAGPTTVTVTTAAAHNLTTGDLVFLSPFANSATSGTSSPKFVNTLVPAGVYTATVTGATTFTFAAPAGAAAAVNDARAAATGGYVHKIWDTTTSVWTEARTKNPVRKNRLMWSPIDEYESAPIDNYVDIGSSVSSILRIVPTITSLFIFKEDGVWRLIGEDGDWSLQELDQSCVLIANETPAVLGGRIFCYSATGVVAVDESGVQKISDAIGGNVDFYYRYWASRTLGTGYTIGSGYMGIGSQEEQAYTLFVGTSQYPDNAFRYHIPTKSWSKQLYTNKDGSGFVPAACMMKLNAVPQNTLQPSSAVMVLSLGSAIYTCDSHAIGVQRKTGYSIDLCDMDFPVTVTAFDTTANTVSISSGTGSIEVGDVFLWVSTNSSTAEGSTIYGTGSVTYRATVTSVASGTITLNISGAVPALSTWPIVGTYTGGFIMKQIKASASYCPDLSGGFDASHSSEIAVAFGSQARFSTCALTIQTDFSPSASTSSTMSGYAWAEQDNWITRDGLTTSNIRTLRSGVPRAAAAAGMIRVILTNNRAWELFDIAGMRINSVDTSPKVRRTNA